MNPRRPVNVPVANWLAESVATSIDRRQFMRKMAKATFFTASAVAAGGGLLMFESQPAFASCGGTNGAGCPTGGRYGIAPCGPSPCCSSLGKGCNCGAPNGTCVTGGNCLGKGNRYGIDPYNAANGHPTGCWTCGTVTVACGNPGCVCNYQTTCCDCRVTSACGTPYSRCISWYNTKIGGPFC